MRHLHFYENTSTPDQSNRCYQRILDGAGDGVWPGAVYQNMQLIKCWKFTAIQDEKQMKGVLGWSPVQVQVDVIEWLWL